MVPKGFCRWVESGTSCGLSAGCCVFSYGGHCPLCGWPTVARISLAKLCQIMVGQAAKRGESEGWHEELFVGRAGTGKLYWCGEKGFTELREWVRVKDF